MDLPAGAGFPHCVTSDGERYLTELGLEEESPTWMIEYSIS
jgi:hypothetical protein